MTRDIIHGARRATFEFVEGKGWRPGWFYDGETPVARFKDHEWLSIGHVHPAFADSVEDCAEGGLLFRGESLYGMVKVPWNVLVRPDAGGGFEVATTFVPAETIDLLEAWTSFEAPYVYDGSETSTCVIGMNPVVRWVGDERVSPPIWANPAWVYGNEKSARRTAACNTPYLCHAITAAKGQPDRYVTLVADWTVCEVKDAFITPTRVIDGLHGYKYILGALNWSSAFAKDPNVLFEAGREYRQRLLVEVAAGECPGGSLDALLCKAWEDAERLEREPDGRIAAYEEATKAGASWAAATKWLRDVMCEIIPAPGLLEPGVGIKTYAPGGRPKFDRHGSWYWWPQWTGLLHYRARMTGDRELEAACLEKDALFADWVQDDKYHGSIAVGATLTPAFHWLVNNGRKDSVLARGLATLLQDTLAKSVAENGRTRAMDSGAQATIAEVLLLGSGLYGSKAMRDQGLLLLEEMARKLDGNFWEFNLGPTGCMMHGGQIRSLGHGHAVMANLVAHRLTGDEHHLRDAHRFARYLLAVSYATHNGSAAPDFDWRGWCNGSNAGRDQIAEFPPWETQNGLLCIASLLPFRELEDGFYDVLWYIGRTGLAQFPAARTVKRVIGTDMVPRYVPRSSIASERDFYDIHPYLAYENPHDQDMPAAYQGTDCLVGEFVYGNGLARALDPRVAALVPGAAHLDPVEARVRTVHYWNPTPAAIATDVELSWPDGRKTTVTETVPSRRALRKRYDAPA
jgi:hypothetical protein